ncbi:metallophosphoesterase [Actinoplanes sp. RD1]|uniref:metallophosphoesterase n=1 Tax=Actinoplanes sp. RD1 TaxID=3064538 RepID=UPI0035572358
MWKRLVKDTFRGRRARLIGGVITVVLAVLVPATLIGVRGGHVKWLAWPGYLWLALMFYLLVVLAVVELPRLAVALWLRARERRGENTAKATTSNPAAEATTSGPATEAITATPATEPAKATTAAAPATEPAAATTTATTTASAATEVAAATSATTMAAGGAGGKAQEAGDGGRPGVERRLVLARGAAIFAGLTAAGITGYGVKTALGGPRLDRVRMPIAKLPASMDGTRLAVVSDIHLGPLTGVRHTERIVAAINSVDADIVCVVGDLVDGSVAELGRFAEPLRGIQSRRGAYFVTGNHEYYSGYQEWVDEVARLGMRPLRNERIELDGLDLAGVNDLNGADQGDAPDFERALGDRDPARPVVLMAHQPLAAKDAAPYGVDLQLSGHTHGGQMAPFNLLVPLQQPVTSGFGEVDGVPVYVTNGAGFWGPPVRVGAPPQVSVIELRSA